MKNINNGNQLALESRDGIRESPWQDAQHPDFIMQKDIKHPYFDAIIIGGGITGITTALLLQLKGKNCVIIEGSKIGFGTSGGTTAHLNTFFDTTYPEIDNKFGKDASKLATQSAKDAIANIHYLVKALNISCDFEYKDGLVYAETDEESSLLDDILKSSQDAGVEVNYTDSNLLPIPFKKVVKFSEQAQFHPIKYLEALSQEFINKGGILLENHFVEETGFEDKMHFAKGKDFFIKGKNLIHATHQPHGINQFNFKCAPYRSYVIGVTLENDSYPDALIYDMQEPYHYFRTHVVDGQKILIIGGEDHKTGHDDPEKAFENLIGYAKEYFKIASIPYKWSSQYYVPADGLPYIGAYPGSKEGAYVATGYNGNGMIFGTVAAQIIADSILKNDNSYADLYKPSRIKPIASFTEFVKENADVAWRFVADKFTAENIDSLNELDNDSGCLIDYDGIKIALYKDETGKAHALNPTCTHAGCIVNWNNSEKSWDCPCHGGRYTVDGKVITGPPVKDLEKLNIK